jgi:RNA-directed DNA polymerase
MDGSAQVKPANVPVAAIQAGEIPARWAWVEGSVWTPRMVAALENGVKGGKWFSLIDKVYAPGNLRSAFAEVKANRGAAGVDRQSIEGYERRLEDNLAHLARQLREGSYRPQALRRVWIPKPGSKERRPLGIPTVRDRVAQAALRHLVEPIFEHGFAEHSYGFRPGRGCKDALRRVDGLLKAGHTWVVDADLKRYFDTIPHRPLLERIGSKVADGRVLALIEAFLGQGVLEATGLWTPEEGSPQGAVISPVLSNIYLDPLDHLMAGAGFEMVRYADDFVILCRSRQEAERALTRVAEWTVQAGLSLHPDKTRIVNAREPGGFEFLGYRFEQGQRWPRTKSLGKLKAALRAKTRRVNGKSLDTIVTEVNLTLRGWFEYFKHSHRQTFPTLDSWLRMRLRSILRRRRGWRGRGRGRDHQRWPNAYFAAHGLFSLAAAHAALRHSSAR